MAYEDIKIRELIEKLKVYSNDKDKYISKIVDNVIFVLVNRRNLKQDKLDEKKLEKFSNYAKQILKDIYEDYVERKGTKNDLCEDIEYVGLGFRFITLRVGDLVLKIGKDDHTIPKQQLDSIYQVPIYIRESYEIGNRAHFRVEVSPYVDTKNITYEDTYKAYSNVRNLGYIWNDPKQENLGRIINVEGCKIGGKKYEPSKYLKKGDLVLIDLDDIAYVGEETSDTIMEEISMMSYNRNVYTFETRYMKEKEEKRVNKNIKI